MKTYIWTDNEVGYYEGGSFTYYASNANTEEQAKKLIFDKIKSLATTSWELESELERAQQITQSKPTIIGENEAFWDTEHI